jgi:hypothetical protein
VRRVVGVIKEGDHLKVLGLTHDDIVDRLGG